MRIVIQCAARKSARAGKFRAADGHDVMFVADPREAPPQTGTHYARPDDLADDSDTWRDRLVAYNQHHGFNPLSLLPGYRAAKYTTNTRTNWHYECADDLISGRLTSGCF